MSGETEASVSGWTTDTLRESVLAQIATERALTDTQIQSLRFMSQERLDGLQSQATERQTSSLRALDAALVSAEKAVQQRADQQEREFHEHLEQYRHETALAFTASDKAIEKAERAAEKRFDSVNEFRQQLADQAATFMPRGESETRSAALAEKIDGLATRIDKSEGKGAGSHIALVYLVSAIAAIGTLISIYLALRGHA